jgi:hypothetical protein
MNRARAKLVRDALSRLRDAATDLRSVVEEMEDSLDRTPENLQNSGSYQNREVEKDGVESAADSLDDVISELEELV